MNWCFKMILPLVVVVVLVGLRNMQLASCFDRPARMQCALKPLSLSELTIQAIQALAGEPIHRQV